MHRMRFTRHTFAFVLFCCLAPPVSSQLHFSATDSSLLGSPLSPEKVVQANIGQLIQKQTMYYRVKRQGSCRSGTKTRYGTRTSIYDYDQHGNVASLLIRGPGINVKYVCRNSYKNWQLVRAEVEWSDEKGKRHSQAFTRHYNAKNLRDTTTLLSNEQGYFQVTHVYDSSALGRHYIPRSFRDTSSLWENEKSYCQHTYLYDSASRIIQYELYSTLGGKGMSPVIRKQVHYDDKGRTRSILAMQKGGDTLLWPLKTEVVYDETGSNSTSYFINQIHDTLWICRDLSQENGKRSITSSTRMHGCPDQDWYYSSVLNISTKGKWEHRYLYEFRDFKPVFKSHEVRDARSGLLRKSTLRTFIRPHRDFPWYKLFFWRKRDLIKSRYRYVTPSKKSAAGPNL